MEGQVITNFYEFGEFRLDVPNRLLWQGEKQIALTPKEFDVLLVLVENAGRVLTKDKLLETIWKDTFVEEATLARNVSWLRKKLATNGNTAKFIETLPKRGYRFSSAVTKGGEQPAVIVEEPAPPRLNVEETIPVENSEPPQVASLPVAPSPATRSSRRNYQWLFAFAFVFAATAIGFAVYQNFSHNREPKIVLLSQSAPFSGLPGRENYPAFSPDGKLLTFVWNGGAGDNFDVYVKQIGAGAPVRLTDTTADEIHPTFSPDGSRVAFVRTFADRSEVFFVPALGGAERKVCDLTVDLSRLSFSPDGRFLAVADSEPREEREGILKRGSIKSLL